MTTTITTELDDRSREQRFDEMVRNHRAKVTRIINAFIGNWQDAEEAVSEALINLWIQRTEMDAVADITGWWVAAARFSALDIVAARRNAPPTMPLLDRIDIPVEQEQGDPAGKRCLADDDVMERVNAALAAMPPRTREAIRLYCLEGLSRSEVAAQMGVKPGTVTYWLYTALHELDLTGPEWQDPHREPSLQSPEAMLVRSCPQLLNRLPKAQREAVRLRYVEKLSAPEAAKVLGTTTCVINSRVSRAKRVLRSVQSSLAAV